LLLKNKERKITLKINPLEETPSFKAKITVKKTTHEIQSTAYHPQSSQSRIKEMKG
jgi:hypothetical protein